VNKAMKSRCGRFGGWGLIVSLLAMMKLKRKGRSDEYGEPFLQTHVEDLKPDGVEFDVGNILHCARSNLSTTDNYHWRFQLFP
jgi:hypothetical protein